MTDLIAATIQKNYGSGGGGAAKCFGFDSALSRGEGRKNDRRASKRKDQDAKSKKQQTIRSVHQTIVVRHRFALTTSSLLSTATMDRHTDAFFTEEQVASFVDHLSEQELCIYINQNDHPASKLTDVISEKSLDVTDLSTGSIVPTASEMAAIRECEELRELQRSRNSGGHCVTIDSLPYVHDDENNHFKTTPGSDEDCCGEREETHEDITTRSVESNFCNDDVNEGSINTNERGVDSSETIIDNEQKINKSLSEDESELGSTDNNKTADCELQPPDTQRKKRKSSYNNINDGIIAQREKIRDISANRERSSKKKKEIRRGNYFNEVRQKYSNFDSESESDCESDEESNKKQDEHQRQQQEVDEQSASNESSEGFLDTEDEQSDDLIEFETQTELPIARKKRKAANSNTLRASSEAIGSSIAKAAATDRGVSSEWISRNDTKRRSKLKKKHVNRVSLEPSSSSSNAVRTNNQTFKARESGGRRKATVGFAAAPRAINKRKTQLSLHQMMTKKK